MRREFVCVRHSVSKLEPITGCKSETAIPRNIDGSLIGKTIRRSRDYVHVVINILVKLNITSIIDTYFIGKVSN